MNDESLIQALVPNGVKKVIALRGLPGSGKSTFTMEAMKAFPGTIARINNDDLSNAIFGKPWVSELGDSSQMFLEFRQEILTNLLKHPKVEIVILDNTNLFLPALRSMERLARDLGAEFIVNDYFLSVPVEVCVERDSCREKKVGSEVIHRMLEKNFPLGPYQYLK